VACEHDEIVVACAAEAEAVAAWLHHHMMAAGEEVVDPTVPSEGETTSGVDWAGPPLEPAAPPAYHQVTWGRSKRAIKGGGRSACALMLASGPLHCLAPKRQPT